MSDITANVVVSMPSQLFTMARQFKAASNGKIYIGLIDTDPKNPANQIQVYLENEDGSHVPVPQPILINAGGYPVYNGQVAKFVTVQGHSMEVLDSFGARQHYFPNILKYDPDQLRQQIEDPDGAVKYPELQMARWRDEVNSRAWGVKGNGTADDTAAINAACAYLQAVYAADGIRRTLVFPDGSYRTSGPIVIHANMSVDCRGKVVFQNIGSDKTFPAFEVQGAARKNIFGIIDAYGAGIRIVGSTHEVEFHTISNCGDGVIIRADTTVAPRASLDNVVRGIQIGKCTNGIVFEQNADALVQQGNEIRVNFISETQNSLLFRNFGGFSHTRASNWDSNFIELIASDPIKIADASMIRNATGFGVPNVTYSIRSWCGGWTPDGGTMCLIRGAFSTGTFYFSLATRPGLNEIVDSAGKGSFGSCTFNVPRYENLGAANAFYQAVTPGAEFNGGVALYRSKFRIRITVPDLSTGQTFGLSFWHVVAQMSGVGRLRLEQYSDAARGRYLIEVRDAGTEQVGMVRLWITNITNATVTGRDVDLIITAS